MTQDHDWRKAEAARPGDRTSGFAPTLSPDDPRARSVSGSVIRDNRRQVVIHMPVVGTAALQARPTPVDAITPVSGVVTRVRPDIPVAKITRDEPTLLHDTHRDAQPPVLAEVEAVPDFASEYVPPQPLPEVSQHKTFELRPVRLAPEIHPRTAPTVLNLRTQQRQHQKQEKDAREIAALIAQSNRRRRGPWIAVLFLIVAGIGFLMGTALVGPTHAEPTIVPDPATESPAQQAPPELPPSSPVPHRPQTASKPQDPGLSSPPPSDAKPVIHARSKTPESRSVPVKPLPNQSHAPTPDPEVPESEPRPLREVWLK